jgi:general secretion pathway protein B
MLSELPQSLRSQIAAINIAGTVYSESPAQRLLLTETGVFSPGSTVVPGVLLEEILANGAIFNFHGTRFQINH